MSKFTLEEVAKHNTADDCWVAMNDNVYDLSNFESTHPGKTAHIKWAGQNIDEVMKNSFDGKGHPAGAFELAKGYLIGTLQS